VVWQRVIIEPERHPPQAFPRALWIDAWGVRQGEI